jgi:hypothetical protein
MEYGIWEMGIVRGQGLERGKEACGEGRCIFSSFLSSSLSFFLFSFLKIFLVLKKETTRGEGRDGGQEFGGTCFASQEGLYSMHDDDDDDDDDGNGNGNIENSRSPGYIFSRD